MKALIILSSILILSTASYATGRVEKKDTLYYLADTAKVPLNDRMVDIGIEAPFKYYTIQCECLAYNQKPTFYFNYEKDGRGEQLSGTGLGTIRLITLSELISLAKQQGNGFNSQHVVFFIEPWGSEYVKHKVMLLKPQKRDPSIDTETIKAHPPGK